ncbi:MAG: aspartokinase [Cyclobacteriaceae bacterium]|nr:MAG: aspartokinase [Cyclobacteriaceae bacterium]
MKVFKFGGAALKDAAGLINTAGIIRAHHQEPLLVVVSAMGNTTNALEEVVQLMLRNEPFSKPLDEITAYHRAIAETVLGREHQVLEKISGLFGEIPSCYNGHDPDALYDQVVSYGERVSSEIVGAYLTRLGLPCRLIDARDYIITDTCYREGKVIWPETEGRIRALASVLNHHVVLTQGFIGCAANGLTTTLGREGSDYTAAIFASCLQAQSVTIWKDVPGVMSADPRRIPNAVVFPELPYKEAAEMTYYGASVIHPKTIKPLALRNIPLYVKCFTNPGLPGTHIHDCHVANLPPLIVFKENQCLVSCKVVDYTFINEDQLSIIFQALSELDIKINVMQNSAISFSFCIDFRESKVMPLVEKLRHTFEVYYNTDLVLITVKNYDAPTFEHYRKLPGVLLEQSSRSTLQVLIRK